MTNWALKRFMDLAMAHVKAVPLAFRLGPLTNAGRSTLVIDKGDALRQAEVLRRVATNAGWGKVMPKGSTHGISCSFGQERGMPTWEAHLGGPLGRLVWPR